MEMITTSKIKNHVWTTVCLKKLGPYYAIAQKMKDRVHPLLPAITTIQRVSHVRSLAIRVVVEMPITLLL